MSYRALEKNFQAKEESEKSLFLAKVRAFKTQFLSKDVRATVLQLQTFVNWNF